MITDREADVLLHTSNTGRYVTDEKAVLGMASAGLLFDHGPQTLAGGMHYLVTTTKGRQALSEWKAVQPKPKVKKRRISREFEAWMDFRDAYPGTTFPEFHAKVWPDRRGWW
jgi:hypothetical protein